MQVYEEIKEMLCKELEEIGRKGELTAGMLDTIDKLTHSIKSLDTIMAMDEYGDKYSHDGDYSRRDRAYGRSSYAGRRGTVRRDAMGRYSRDEAKDEMIHELRELMSDAHDEKTRSEFHKFINKLETM